MRLDFQPHFTKKSDSRQDVIQAAACSIAAACFLNFLDAELDHAEEQKQQDRKHEAHLDHRHAGATSFVSSNRDQSHTEPQSW